MLCSTSAKELADKVVLTADPSDGAGDWRIDFALFQWMGELQPFDMFAAG